MTEGFLQNLIKSTLQTLRVAYGNPPPFTQGRLNVRTGASPVPMVVGRLQATVWNI